MALGVSEERLRALVSKVVGLDRRLTSYLLAYLFCQVPPAVGCWLPSFLANVFDFYYDWPWQVTTIWFISQPLTGMANALVFAHHAATSARELRSERLAHSVMLSSDRASAMAPTKRGSQRFPGTQLVEWTPELGGSL